MGALGNPKPWVPFMDTKDCSQGFCSFYCPQWCYIILPPPPPIESPDDSSGSTFSPLVIAIIGILASAFFLVSYYVIISKYCGNRDSARRRENRVGGLEESDDDPSNHEPWHVATAGLDDALIKSITVFKYKKDDGLIEGTDCSVCLSEFKEDESLRLLPKCTHAFHVLCIDTWLKSHSSCPLCRANIVFISSSPLPLPAAAEPRSNGESLSDTSSSTTNRNSAAGGGDLEMGYREVEEEEEVILQPSNSGPKTPRRALSDLGNSEEGDAFVEIRNLGAGGQEIRRSVSMDCRFSIADVLRLKQEDEDFQGGDVVGSSKRAISEMTSKSSCQRSCRVLHCVMSPVAMKRSFSSGRFSFPRCGRGRNTMIPL